MMTMRLMLNFSFKLLKIVSVAMAIMMNNNITATTNTDSTMNLYANHRDYHRHILSDSQIWFLYISHYLTTSFTHNDCVCIRDQFEVTNRGVADQLYWCTPRYQLPNMTIIPRFRKYSPCGALR